MQYIKIDNVFKIYTIIRSDSFKYVCINNILKVVFYMYVSAVNSNRPTAKLYI